MRRMTRGLLLAGAVATFAAHGYALAQEDEGRLEFGRAGCATCHGPAAQGAEAPELAGTTRSYGEFVRIVREGTGEMSPQTKDQVTDEQLVVIHKWLVRLSSKQARPAGAGP
jgi:mono/diheme cytochrome c family protein